MELVTGSIKNGEKMKNDKLLPCPFCGSEALLHTVESHSHILATFMPDYTGGSFIECTNCTCSMSGDNEEEAISVWNTRKPVEKVVEQLEEMRIQAEKDMQLSDTVDEANVYGGKMLAYEVTIAIVQNGGNTDVSETNVGNNGWVPVSERLPEESFESVIGWDEYRKRCVFVQYRNGRWILGLNETINVNITAWQPLPKPYTGEKQ